MTSGAELTERTSVRAVADFPELEVVDSLSSDDVLVYGTSDPTINPAEVWMTSEVADRTGAEWQFFNYPLDSKWVSYDVNNLFIPYPFYRADPLEVIPRLGLKEEVLSRLRLRKLQSMVPESDPLRQKTLEEVTVSIKACRQMKSFVVVNELLNGRVTRVYGSRKDKRRYRDHYGLMTVGQLLGDQSIKLGGAVIYFIFGYYAARRSQPVLFPNNDRGDVWGAVAAGVKEAGNGPLRLYPIGGLDLMTGQQWACWRKTGVWKKAPAWVVARLQTYPFGEELRRALLTEKRYCAVGYHEDSDRFYFELGTPR